MVKSKHVCPVCACAFDVHACWTDLTCTEQRKRSKIFHIGQIIAFGLYAVRLHRFRLGPSHSTNQISVTLVCMNRSALTAVR